MSEFKILSTPNNVRFGLIGNKPSLPAPTIFVFALDIEETLSSDYSQVGQLLRPDGFLCVSLDVPGHGADADISEPNALLAWRNRIERGENPVASFTAQVSDVLNFLIEEDYTDAQRVAVVGTSRGGFLAAHAAAADKRFRCVAPIAPVADLLQLSEFEGVQLREAVEALKLTNIASRLVHRSVWIIIGNNDTRVDTDSTIAFARSIVQAAVLENKEADVELHVVAEAGHVTPQGSHEQAAAWLRGRL